MCNNKTADSRILHDVARSFYTELHGDFFEVDCVEERYTEALRFFLFQVSGFRFVAQSLAKFYIEFHGVFFEVDCVERAAQSPKLRTFHFFCFFATD